MKVWSEHKFLEEYVVRLDEINDEVSFFGIMCQCHLKLMRK